MSNRLGKKTIPVIIGMVFVLMGTSYLLIYQKSGNQGEMSEIDGIISETVPPKNHISSQNALDLNNANGSVNEFFENDGIEISAVLPRSLQNSGTPAELDVDENGQLVVNIKVRNLFDYYLSALGEESEAELIERIKRELSVLPPDAHARATDILKGYLSYKTAMDEYLELNPVLAIESAKLSPQEIRQYEKNILSEKIRLRFIRNEHMDSETIFAFYDVEDRHDSYISALDAITDNAVLSDDERWREQEIALQQMPEWFQVQEKRKIQRSRLNSLDRAAMTAAEFNQRRLEIVGPEAAARLEALDKQRSEWDARVSAFNNEKAALEQQWGGSDSAGYLQAVEALQRQSFSETELMRIQGQEELREELLRLKQEDG